MKVGTDLMFVKLGGSLITDKAGEFAARPDVIRRLADEMRQALALRPTLRIVLGHGSGSFGHLAASRYGTADGATTPEQWRGMVETAATAARLNRIVTDICLEAGLPVLSVPPSASARCENRELVWMAICSIEQSLLSGLVPIVFGDVAFDLVRGCTILSTEQLFAYLIARMPPARILLTGVVDGVFESDPTRNPGAQRIAHIGSDNIQGIRKALGGSNATDVTGGMLSKVMTLYPQTLLRPELLVHLFSGEVPGRLLAAMTEDEPTFGTTISSGKPPVE